MSVIEKTIFVLLNEPLLNPMVSSLAHVRLGWVVIDFLAVVINEEGKHLRKIP